MRLISPLSMFVLSASSAIAQVVPAGLGSIARRDRQPDSQTIAAWEKTGVCFSYFDIFDPERAARPCVKYCKEVEKKEGAIGCRGPVEKKEEIDPSIVWQDDDGNDYTPGVCICDGIEEVAEVFLDIVVDALQQLDEVICSVFLSTFDTIIQTGLLLVPGGFEAKIASDGVRLAVQGAKTFIENGSEVADFFGGWVGPACNLPDWNFDLLGTIFGVLTNAPDSTGTSIGCVRKNKAACKKPDPKPDPPPKEKGPDDNPNTADVPSPTTKPSESEKTTTTASTTSTTTAENACAARSTDKPKRGTKRAADLGLLDLLQAPAGRAAELLNQFCASPWKKPGQASKRGAERGDLQARADPPIGYTEILPGGVDFTQRGRPGVWSRDYGTCPGVVLVGKPKNSNNYKGYLLHMSLGEERGYFQLRTAFNGLIDAVGRDEMTDMRGWLYTVDTRPTSPELVEFPDLAGEIEALEPFYVSIWGALQRLVDCGVVRREYHPFGQVGQIEVDPNCAVHMEP
ncbi:hypothetical protein jhhlp_005430 [Lomentospora prolificans]|uniref:Uncharacterized protein n=1 Tax=Lomentospora prolificans TaxID=41688 RepID=A0A2N3N6W9_9PEZI|nr:hypothetical protein jhhlp_005430 [Lomentospora prolificans]